MYLSTGLNHVHGFSFVTSVSDQHTHTMAGATSLGLAYGASHVHNYKGTTSRENGHVHYYSGMTGPAVYLLMVLMFIITEARQLWHIIIATIIVVLIIRHINRIYICIYCRKSPKGKVTCILVNKFGKPSSTLEKTDSKIQSTDF